MDFQWRRCRGRDRLDCIASPPTIEQQASPSSRAVRKKRFLRLPSWPRHHDQRGPPVQQITAQVRVHRAFFENSPVEFYFVNVVNPSAISDVVITHVWYGGSVRIDILNPDRPLPQRLQPRQPWETWIAVHEVPRDRDAFYNFRVKVSTGEEFASEHARDIPPRGFVRS